MSSVVSLRNRIPDHHNLGWLLKDINNKHTVFEVKEINEHIVESTMLDNQKFINSIYECEVVVIILNEPLEEDIDYQTISFLSKIEIYNCIFELLFEVITKNIDHLEICGGEVY